MESLQVSDLWKVFRSVIYGKSSGQYKLHTPFISQNTMHKIIVLCWAMKIDILKKPQVN